MTVQPDFSGVVRLLDQARTARAFPAATIEVGRCRGVLWRHATGRLTYDADATPATTDTLFDLASLTKVIATAPLLMHPGRETARVALDAGPDAASGVAQPGPARRDPHRSAGALRGAYGVVGPVQAKPQRGRVRPRDRRAAARYRPRTRSIYSDLGFLLLGFIVAERGGRPLDVQFETLLGDTGMLFRPPPDRRAAIAPTEDDATWRGRLLVGEVHDENAAALGGVAGHAGLFGSAPAVGAYARLVLETLRRPTRLGAPWLLQRFLRKSRVPRSSRALAWDTMRPTSSCGMRLSRAAFGHTGFTGTSLWIDPLRDLYVVLLTNRVHPDRPADRDDALRRLRPQVHDAVVMALAG